MCESNVYLKTNGTEELIMENVASIMTLDDNKFLLKGLFGEHTEIIGKIEDINLISHKIIFQK